MSGRTYAADDRDAISERLAASFKCTCLSAVAADGTTDWKLTPDCPLHRVATPAPEPATFLWSLRVHCSCPVGPDGIVHVGGCELQRHSISFAALFEQQEKAIAEAFCIPAGLLSAGPRLTPERRAEIVARIRASLAAAHFRIGR